MVSRVGHARVFPSSSVTRLSLVTVSQCKLICVVSTPRSEAGVVVYLVTLGEASIVGDGSDSTETESAFKRTFSRRVHTQTHARAHAHTHDTGCCSDRPTVDRTCQRALLTDSLRPALPVFPRLIYTDQLGELNMSSPLQ